jgi:hypothetical protein
VKVLNKAKFLKISLKQLIVLVAVSSLLSGVVTAAYWIYSSVQTVAVTDYVVTLNVAKNGLELTFTGALTYNGAGVSGKTVVIYQTDSNGNNGVQVATATSQPTSGSYSATYQVQTIGTYYFKAGCQVP